MRELPGELIRRSGFDKELPLRPIQVCHAARRAVNSPPRRLPLRLRQFHDHRRQLHFPGLPQAGGIYRPLKDFEKHRVENKTPHHCHRQRDNHLRQRLPQIFEVIEKWLLCILREGLTLARELVTQLEKRGNDHGGEWRIWKKRRRV